MNKRIVTRGQNDHRLSPTTSTAITLYIIDRKSSFIAGEFKNVII